MTAFLSFSYFLSLILFSLPRPFPSPAMGGGREKYCSQRSFTKRHLRTPRLASALRARPHRDGAARICRAPPQSDKAQRGAPGGGREDRREPWRGARGRAVRDGGGRGPRGARGEASIVYTPPRPVLKQRPGDCGLRNVSNAWQAGAALVTICFQ